MILQNIEQQLEIIVLVNHLHRLDILTSPHCKLCNCLTSLDATHKRPILPLSAKNYVDLLSMEPWSAARKALS